MRPKPTRPLPDSSVESLVAAAIRGALRIAVGRRRDVAAFAATAARLWTIARCPLPEGVSLWVDLVPGPGGRADVYVAAAACCGQYLVATDPSDSAEAVRELVACAASNALEAAADNHAAGKGCAAAG